MARTVVRVTATRRLLLVAIPAASATARDSRLRRWAAVGAFVVFLFATIPIGFPIAAAIVVRIGHDAFRNSISAAATLLGAGFLWHVFRQPHLRRLPVEVAPERVRAAFLDAIESGSAAARVRRLVWQQSGLPRVEKRPPDRLASGKVPVVHRLGRESGPLRV